MGYPALELGSKTAVVIGGTSGIGLSLAQAGANVVPTGRRADLVQSAADEVANIGRETLAQTCDVTDKGSLEGLFNAVRGKFGAVDILVNCAGQTKRTATLDLPESEWNAILETNLNGTLRACQVFGRPMIERRYGRIINIASLSSFVALHESGSVFRQQGGGSLAHQAPRDRVGPARSVCERHRSRGLPYRFERNLAGRFSSWAGTAAAHADAALWGSSMSLRGGGVSRFRRRRFSDGPFAGSGRRIPCQWRQSMRVGIGPRRLPAGDCLCGKEPMES